MENIYFSMASNVLKNEIGSNFSMLIHLFKLGYLTYIS